MNDRPACRSRSPVGGSLLWRKVRDLTVHADAEDAAAIKRSPALVDVHAANDIELLLWVDNCVTCALHFSEVERIKGHLPFGAVSLPEVDRDKATASFLDLGADDLVVGHWSVPVDNGMVARR